MRTFRANGVRWESSQISQFLNWRQSHSPNANMSLKLSLQSFLGICISVLLITYGLQDWNLRQFEQNALTKNEVPKGGGDYVLDATKESNDDSNFQTKFQQSSFLPDYVSQCESSIPKNLTLNNRTCSSIFQSKSKQNPEWTQDCLKDPSRPSCMVECLEYPGKTSMKNVSPKHSTLWPPIGQGSWVEDASYCQVADHFCFLGKYRFDLPDLHVYSPQDACTLLRQNNITVVHIVGDSLMRQVSVALGHFLRNNWNDLWRNQKPYCIGDRAFADEACRVINVELPVCSQQGYQDITFIFNSAIPRNPVDISPPRSGSKTLTLYGTGNHPPQGDYGKEGVMGMLNATGYKQTKWATFNRTYFWGENHLFLWLPTHYKLSIFRTVELNERALDYMIDSDEFFSSLGASSVNTFSMTEAAARFLYQVCPNDQRNSHFGKDCVFHSRETCNLTNETWDGYHYARSINVWKMQLILNQLARQMKD
jgi:hypothetical protein